MAEVKTNTRKKKAAKVDVESVSPVVRRTRRTQISEQVIIFVAIATISSHLALQEVIMVEPRTNTRKRKAPVESNVENVSVSPVVRRTRRSKMVIPVATSAV